MRHARLFSTFRCRCRARPSATAAAGRTTEPHPRTKDKAMDNDTDLTQLDDFDFLAERRRVREELEHTPEQEVSAELTARYETLDEEFLRRARIAWAGDQR
jgi:hypothetical protein